MKVYIIPTRFGLACAGLLGVMVFSGIIYSNNSILLLAFLLASLVLALMLETHTHLKSIKVISFEIGNGFVGGVAELRLVLKNTRRHAIEGFEFYPNAHISDRISLGPEEQRLTQVAIPVSVRGKQYLKRLRIGTSAPVGLFWAWSYIPIQSEFLGYPRPAGRADLPEPKGNEGYSRNRSHSVGDDFTGHRLFVEGESWRRVDWKAVSRGRPWMVKNFEGGEPDHWLFDFRELPGPVEDRLSQLSLWIQRASKDELRFGLNVDKVKIPVAAGPQHASRCLKELALYENHKRAA